MKDFSLRCYLPINSVLNSISEVNSLPWVDSMGLYKALYRLNVV